MKKVQLLLLILLTTLYGDVTFAEPKPSIMEPRKILFSIVGGKDEEIHHVLSIANNTLKFYGPENVEMRIIAYSKGIRALKKSETEFAIRIDALMQYDVEFVACGNAMRTFKLKKSDLIDGSEVVTAGVAEMIERVKEGWIYIRP